MKKFLLLLSFSFKLLAMQGCKVVPVSNNCIFSPNGKYLLSILEEYKIIHETRTGKVVSVLDNVKTDNSGFFIFSPQGTYIRHQEQIWKTATGQEHLPEFQGSKTVLQWNPTDTIFLAKEEKSATLHACDAVTGKTTRTINCTHASLKCYLNNNGSFAALRGMTASNYGITLVNLLTGSSPLFIERGTKAAFCSDNLHVLVEAGNHIWVINAPEGTILYGFNCADRVIDRLAITNFVELSLYGSQAIITNLLDKTYYYTITQHGNTFIHEKHLVATDEEPIFSNTGKFRILFRPAEKRGRSTAFLNTVENPDSDKPLFENIEKDFCEFYFGGEHDEHLFIADRHTANSKVHVWQVTPLHCKATIPFESFVFSPDNKSFVMKSLDNKTNLFILPSHDTKAADDAQSK